MTKVLVCGGRDYQNSQYLLKMMDFLYSIYGFTELIEGGARGADHLAASWRIYRDYRDITHTRVDADWSLGLKAGPIRNQRMLDEHKPNYVVAFPGGKGTRNMIKLAEKNMKSKNRCVDWIYDLREEPSKEIILAQFKQDLAQRW